MGARWDHYANQAPHSQAADRAGDRLEEIRARLSECDDFGTTRWHSEACSYLRTGGAYECDCMRSDVEWLVELAATQHDTVDMLLTEWAES